MTEISEWEWAIGAGVMMAILILGGFTSRLFDESQADDQDDLSPSGEKSELDELREKLKARDCELDELREKLKACDCELTEAQEEAELTLLQLHQVQEELEHYFLESRELHQKLDMTRAVKPEQLEQLQRIKDRLVQLYKTMPANHEDSDVSTRYVQLQELVLRQHHALSRFERLHASGSINMKAHQL